MQILFKKTEIPCDTTLLIGVHAGNQLSKTAKKINALTDGALTRMLDNSGFDGKIGETYTVAGGSGLSVNRLICVGLGDKAESSDLNAQLIGAAAMRAVLKTQEKTAEFATDDLPAAQVAFGAKLAAYRFDKYKTLAQKPVLEQFVLLTPLAQEAQNDYEILSAAAKGVYTARDLMNEPANMMTPKDFAARAEELKKYGLTVEIYDKKQLASKGFNMMLGVAQGSANEPVLAVVQWKGAAGKDVPFVVVGKGVCFDSGGISLKPAAHMDEMKFDMAGAAIALGTLQTLAMRKAKVNAAAVMALVENMPSGSAQRPGDIVKSLAGLTVEVANTDAEGRLILGDAMWYAQERFAPAVMVDLATLTGACVVALGHEYAGLFSNDSTVCDAVKKASDKTGERVWEMPLCDDFDKQIESDVADIRNMGSVERSAGSCIAAAFLKRFVKPETKWVHLDIAGTAYLSKDTPLSVKGATAFGVRLLNAFSKDYFEEKAAE